jgi:glycosyltransferase involved in cell wall biosynthesis
VWPAEARPLRLVLTVHDLIPFVFPEHYFPHPAAKRWFHTRLHLVRCADHVVVPSEATKRDVTAYARIPEGRVTVTGEGVSEQFRPPDDREAALAELRARRPEILPGFVLSVGGADYRKNLPTLLTAYARLPRDLRAAHQLVVAGYLSRTELAELRGRVRDLEIDPDVVLAGSVSEDDLLLLYQATHLFVFPSLYEGFGLPVAEARASGAPVIASRASSIPEVLTGDAGLFDPLDREALRAALERGIADTSYRSALLSMRVSGECSWRRAAERTVEVHERVLAHAPRRGRPRPRVAVFEPPSSTRDDLRAYALGIAGALASTSSVDVFAQVDPGRPATPRSGWTHGERFALHERLHGGYEGIAYVADAGRVDGTVARLLRVRSGTVLAPVQTRRLSSPRSHARLAAAVGAAERFVVHSRAAEDVARFHAAPHDRPKIERLPMPFPPPAEPGLVDEPTVGVFGPIGAPFRTTTVLDAFARIAAAVVDAQLLLIGRLGLRDSGLEAFARLDALGLRDRVRIGAPTAGPRLRTWLRRVAVSLQLADEAAGDAPAALVDCIAAGVPTVASAIGFAAELPDDVLVKLDPAADADEVAETVLRLLHDRAERERLQAAALAYATEHSFAATAEQLLPKLVAT